MYDLLESLLGIFDRNKDAYERIVPLLLAVLGIGGVMTWVVVGLFGTPEFTVREVTFRRTMLVESDVPFLVRGEVVSVEGATFQLSGDGSTITVIAGEQTAGLAAGQQCEVLAWLEAPPGSAEVQLEAEELHCEPGPGPQGRPR